MAAKTLYKLNSDVVVTLKTADFDAVSFSINIKSLAKCVSFVLFCFFVFGLCTLLFFRELEMTRKLQDQVLKMEIAGTLTAPTNVRAPSPPSKAEEAVPVASTPRTPNESIVTARIQEFATDCQDGICNVQLSLIPSQTGVAQGELLVVLEAEVPRIGTGTAASSIRKRFFTYPGNEAKDELSDVQVQTLPRKPYRFAKALQTSTEFSVGDVLRPIAVNLYLYDAHKNLIQHERRTIETGESNVQ